jgi:hypothetical protein
MLVRLRRVLYWLGVFLAVLCTLGALSVIIEDWNRGNWKYCDWIWPAVFAVAFWLGGRGARYILSNE